MEVEERVAVGLAMRKQDPTSLIGSEEARAASVVPDVEVVGVVVAHTIEGYPPHAALPRKERGRNGGRVREEEPRDLTRRQGPLDNEPPIVAHPRYAEAVDEARYTAGDLR